MLIFPESCVIMKAHNINPQKETSLFLLARKEKIFLTEKGERE